MDIDNNFPTFEKIYKTMKHLNTYKQIFLYLLRVVVFLGLNRNFAYSISNFIVFPIFNLLFKNYNFEAFVDAGCYSIFVIIIHYYLTQKLCGLFKKLDNLNFFLSFTIIILIDILLNYSMATTVQIVPTIKIAYSKTDFFFILSVLFLVYKFFNFLSKKFILFQKIGYYTSIEFYKDLINKIKVKISR